MEAQSFESPTNLTEAALLKSKYLEIKVYLKSDVTCDSR